MSMEFRHTIKDAHPKPILCAQYNPFRRELYTAGEDATIRVWDSSGKPMQKIQTGSPIYCLAYNARRQQLMAGQTKKVRLFQLIPSDESYSSQVLEKKSIVCSEHSDMVSCIVSCEGRFYSVGYDRKIVIYDVSHHGDLKLYPFRSIKDAHDAAISTLVYGKDADNSWLITGSFDRVVKLWSLDGNLMQRFDGFANIISSCCYVVPSQTLWVTANSSIPLVYDPRSGINVSDFVRTDHERYQNTGASFGLKSLLFIPENNEVIAITTRRSILVWKYNAGASLTVLPGHMDIVECLTFTSKEPLLIFSGGDDGIIRKWERLQLNTFMYSFENLSLPRNDLEQEIETEKVHASKKEQNENETVKQNRPSVNCLVYYEDLDYLVSGYEDSRICIWGYNEESVNFEEEQQQAEEGNEGVSNRVAGMSLKATLNEHRESVTALVCFQHNSKHWMVSTGWDRRICVWDLETLQLQDVFHNHNGQTAKEELAADGIILAIDYSPERNEFAYASSDKLAYVRRFSSNGGEMKLMAVLQGHEAEVTQIKWHKKYKQWITGSEDRTVRIWHETGLPCLRVINNDGPVTAICIDAINGCLITGSQDKIIRVFDLDKKDEIVQKNVGHTDEIRSVIHIPARNQYVSASWDNTVRVWNAYLKKGQRRTVKVTTYQAAIQEEEEPMPTFSDLNPLIVPKLLTKPVFAADFVIEKPTQREEDANSHAERSALEEELRQTLNDLDVQLNSNDVILLILEAIGQIQKDQKASMNSSVCYCSLVFFPCFCACPKLDC
ncbi:WD40-repeat-containing domain protein [Gorgonomyces haynaldii]|nr:WD40-repeat-containing domain protein [Gorgonomyces haynaldii]